MQAELEDYRGLMKAAIIAGKYDQVAQWKALISDLENRIEKAEKKLERDRVEDRLEAEKKSLQAIVDDLRVKLDSQQQNDNQDLRASWIAQLKRAEERMKNIDSDLHLISPCRGVEMQMAAMSIQKIEVQAKMTEAEARMTEARAKLAEAQANGRISSSEPSSLQKSVTTCQDVYASLKDSGYLSVQTYDQFQTAIQGKLNKKLMLAGKDAFKAALMKFSEAKSERDFQTWMMSALVDLYEPNNAAISSLLESVRRPSFGEKDLIEKVPGCSESNASTLLQALRNINTSVQADKMTEARATIRQYLTIHAQDTHTPSRANTFLKTSQNHFIYPDVTLIYQTLSASSLFLKAIIELKLSDLNAGAKGELIEQLKAALINDPVRKCIWGALITSTSHCCLIQAVQTDSSQNFSFLEYTFPFLNGDEAQNALLSFLCATDDFFGCTSLPLTNASNYIVTGVLGHGASGTVYQASRKRDASIIDNVVDDGSCASSASVQESQQYRLAGSVSGGNLIVAIKRFESKSDYQSEKTNLTTMSQLSIDVGVHVAMFPSIVETDDIPTCLVLKPVGVNLKRFKHATLKINISFIHALISLMQHSPLVHLDIRPQNIAYFCNGGQWRIYLLDWAYAYSEGTETSVCGTIKFAADDILEAAKNSTAFKVRRRHALQSIVRLAYYWCVMGQAENLDAIYRESDELSARVSYYMAIQSFWKKVLSSALWKRAEDAAISENYERLKTELAETLEASSPSTVESLAFLKDPRLHK